jgi:hypothetical protein
MTDDLVKRLRDGVPCCDPDAGNGEGSFYVDDANETMCEAADRIEALTAKVARAIEVELSMCAIANAEAPSEWIDGFEFAWKRVKEALGDWKSEAGDLGVKHDR